MADTGSTLVHVWRLLERRYGSADGGCGCDVSDRTVATLRGSDLHGETIAAYRRGDASMADLVSTADLDVDPASVDDLSDLAASIQAAGSGGG